MPRNPTWQRDELILALDLYFRLNYSAINKTHPEIVKLSAILNELPIHPDRPDPIRFRNANGVYMKLGNFLVHDPSYKGKGLRGGGKLEAEIWKTFAHDPDHLHAVAEALIQSYQDDVSTTERPVSEDEEELFPEGKVLYRVHRRYERNGKLIRLAKEREMDLVGRLTCRICTFDFANRYGHIGSQYIEAHHTLPVSQLGENRTSRLSDIALVCANCHRMLHRKRPWLGIQELGLLLQGGEDGTTTGRVDERV